MPEEKDVTGVVDTTTPEASSATGEPTDQRAEAQPDTATQEQLPSSEPEGPQPYTDEELAELNRTGGMIDRKRLTPAQEALRRTLEAGYTPRFQEAARLKEEAEKLIAQTQEKSEPYFSDANKNKVFTDYLDNPMKITADINSEIARLEEVTQFDDEGQPNTKAYREARKAIAYWQSVKDEFSMKRQDIISQRETETAVTKELGDLVPTLIAYARTLGFTKQQFMAQPKLRQSVKLMFDVATAAKTADKKEVKPTPQKSPTSGGGTMPQGTKPDLFDPKLSSEQRIAMFKAQKQT